MEVLIVISLVVLLIILRPGYKSQSITDEKPVAAIEQCPPHQWMWQEVLDQDGIKTGQQMVCKVCGPLAKQCQ